MLTVQHRCKGDIHKWLSDTFYHGQVVKSKDTPKEAAIIRNMRDFVRTTIGVPTPTNRYGVNIELSRHTRPKGETSSINEAEIFNLMADLTAMRSNKQFAGMTFGVLSFYKAQVLELKRQCRGLPDVTILEGNELVTKLSCQTVEQVQGGQFDVVLLSFVNTRNATFAGEPHRLLVALSRARYVLGVYFNWSLSNGRPTSENRYIKSLFDNLQKCNHIADRNWAVVDTRACRICEQVGHLAQNCTQQRIPRLHSLFRSRRLGKYDGTSSKGLYLP